ncbi:MAG: glycosyltransferase [Kiritimatiellia bacterium]
MPSAVLIVSSTRVHVDAPEILRIQDVVATLLEQGRAVDVLVPRVSPLLTAALPAGARVFTAPRLPFCEHLPPRPSIRRLLSALILFFRCVSLVSRRSYDVLHGFNDGALVVRATDRVTVKTYPYVAEVHTPLTSPGFFKGPRSAFSRALERAALRHAAAIILPDAATLSRFGNKIPRARVSLIPDPHADFAPDSFTYGEFATAIQHVYDYVLRPRPEK